MDDIERRRFAYIVDVSGSMAAGTRFTVAIDELKRSITALPDFASMMIILFSSAAMEPPFQESYLKANPANVARMKKWLDTMSPMGGTEPGGATAFASLLSGRYRPQAGERVAVLVCGSNPASLDFTK